MQTASQTKPCKKMCPGYDTKLSLMVEIEVLNFDPKFDNISSIYVYNTACFNKYPNSPTHL